MRVLALDLGSRRTGTAVSDPSGVLARPLDVIERAGDGEADVEAVVDLVIRLDVDRVLIGHPLHLSGAVGEQARRVEAFAGALRDRIDVPVILWDERLSTVSAKRLLIEQGESPSAQRDRIDSVAAAIILQDYLDAGHGRDQDRQI